MAKKGDIRHPPSPKTETQRELINAIQKKDMVIVTGPAGTGKTYIPAAYAGAFKEMGKVDKIILTRPTVPTGRSIGFFPGTLEEKMEPWIAPFMVGLTDQLGKAKVEYLLKKGQIEIVPFEVIRGRTFDNAFVILDEAQNASVEEVKAFVTRTGTGSITVINGDTSQSDLKGCSGLSYLVGIVKGSKELQEAVAHVEFTADDIVRSGLCKLWVQSFNNKQ